MSNNSIHIFKRVASWQKAGHVGPTTESITSKISQAFLDNEITDVEKRAMLNMTEELKVSVAALKMVDAFLAAKKINSRPKTARDFDILDTLIHGVDELTDVISTSGDPDLVFIQKSLRDYLTDAKVNSQTTSEEQGDYEHAGQEPEETKDFAHSAPKEPANAV